MTSPTVPFVNTRLDVLWLANPPPDLLCFWSGPAAAWRLTPAVYAHLFHAVERKAAQPGADPATIAEALVKLDAVHAALVNVYDPADVYPWSATTPPLPDPPRVPRFDLATPGRIPDLPQPGPAAGHGSSSPSSTPAVATGLASARKPRARPAKRNPAAADAIATGTRSAGMFDGLG